MNEILLRILIFVFCCLIGLGMVSLVGSRSVVSKKEITHSITEECQDNVCPVPKDYKGDKK